MAKKNKSEVVNKIETTSHIIHGVNFGRSICLDAKEPVQGNYYTECPKCGFIHVEVLNDNK